MMAASAVPGLNIVSGAPSMERSMSSRHVDAKAQRTQILPGGGGGSGSGSGSDNRAQSSGFPRLERLTSASSLSAPPFLNAALRRGSDSSVNAGGSSMVGGLARRLPISTATEADTERNHLLRSVSHLSKDQTTLMPPVGASEGSDGLQEADRPFTRFDLLPPPNYQRVRNPRKPSYGVRGGIGGRSFSDGRRGMYDARSSSMQETAEVDTSRSQIGFSHAYKSGNGKAKAISAAAAAKFRRMSVSQVSGRKASNDASGSTDMDSTAARQATQQQAQQAQQQNHQARAAQDSPNSRPRAFTAPTSKAPSQNSSSSAVPVSGPTEAGEWYHGGESTSRDASPASGLPKESTTCVADLSSPSQGNNNSAAKGNTNKVLGAGGEKPNALKQSALEKYKGKAHSTLWSTSPISQDPPQVGGPLAPATTSTTTASTTTTTAEVEAAELASQSVPIHNGVLSDAELAGEDRVDGNALPVHPSRKGASASAALSYRAANAVHSPPSLESSGAEDPTPVIGQPLSSSSNNNIRLSFDTATGLNNLTSSSFDAPGIPHEDNAPSSSGMTSGSSTLQSRRGSAPTDSVGRRRSAFRLGLMKLSGSTVDLTSLGSKPQSRRGSHLEASGKDRSIGGDDGLGNRPANADDAPRSRLSLSLNRRLQPTQDSPRSNASSFMGKFNKSRDQLPTTASLSMDEERRGSLDKAQKNESNSTARQFLLRAFRRPSQPQAVAAASTDTTFAPSSSTLNSGSNEDRRSQNSVSPEDTEEILESAFGPLQRSDARSAEEFEQREAKSVPAYDAATKARAMMNREDNVSATRRSSRDSASTSFFSITEGSLFPSRGDSSGGIPFDRSRNVTRGTEQSSRSHSAVRMPVVELDEEGPLGERRPDRVVQLQDSPAVAYLKMNMPGSRQANTAIVTSPSEQSSSNTHQTVSTVPSSLHPVQSIQDEAFGQENGSQAAKTDILITSHDLADEEQEAITEAAGASQIAPLSVQDTGSVTLQTNDASETRESGDQSRGNSRRPGWSSRLSHLPRLNSMRAVSGASTTAGDGGEADGNDEDDDERRRSAADGSSRRASEDHASDTDTGDDDAETSETESELTTDDSEEEAEGNHNAMPGSLPEPSQIQTPTALSGSSSTRPRPGDITLPPVPVFGDNSQAASSIVSAATPASDAEERLAVGQASWTRFQDVMTPFETPRVSATPTLADPSGTAKVASGAMMTGVSVQRAAPDFGRLSHTPLAMADTDSSYFDIKSTTGRTGSGIPPPSPSIITRSRAASSSSKRALRSPSKDIPPLPPMTPLQMQTIEGARKTGRITAANYVAPAAIPAPGPSAESSSAATQRMLPPSPLLGRPSSMASAKDVARSQEAIGKVSNGSTSSMPPPPLPSPVAASFKSAAARQNSARPSLYQQQSRSLIDLSAMTARKTREDVKPTSPFSLGTVKPNIDSGHDASHDSSVVQSPSGSATPASGVRRRRSMYEVGAQPPPYAVIHKRPEGPQMIFPREEEGKESLPRYSCAVHIEGYLPRKMEFSSPGIQAKDRSWRRQYFVLHGTCLKVYKTDLSGENLVGKGAWGEVEGVHVHTAPMNEDGPSAPTSGNVNAAASGKEASSATANGHVGGGSGSSGLNAAVEAVSALTGSFIAGGGKGGLVKTYSLQGAESGLAADYLKRRHVVRVRVEGEQFLLQTRNDRHVVDWIEAFQAATNVSLDLERRPMPKFITLPRRRRRRRRGEAATGDPAREANDLEEAQRRSLLDAQGQGGTRSTSRSLPPARPLGLPGDESPNASAAFDDMLREDQDDLMRQDAADV